LDNLTVEPEKLAETLNKILKDLSLVTQNGFITDANGKIDFFHIK